MQIAIVCCSLAKYPGFDICTSNCGVTCFRFSQKAVWRRASDLFKSAEIMMSWMYQQSETNWSITDQWAVVSVQRGEVKFLICTDVAARGIDVSGLPYGKSSLP